MDWYNYLEIPTFLARGYKFMYVDTDANYGKTLFEFEGIRADCMLVGRDKEDTPYILMECDIADNEKQKFINAMDQLVRKMAFNGHRDYLRACHRIFGYEDPK